MSTLTSIMSSQTRSPSHRSRDADGMDEDTQAKHSFLALFGLQPVSSSSKSPTSSATQEPSNQQRDNVQDLNNAELPGELEDQEMARLVEKTKLRWKLEAQAVAQATKEARRQKAIKAKEDRRLKREQKEASLQDT